MTSLIESRLNERTSRKAELLRRAEEIRAEISVVEIELRLLQELLDATGAPPYVTSASSVVAVPVSAHEASLNLRYAGSRMSPVTKAIFSELARRYPDPMTSAEITEWLERAGYRMDYASQRSMLSTTAKRGWLERLKVGVYRITPVGAQVAKVQLGGAPAKNEGESPQRNEPPNGDDPEGGSYRDLVGGLPPPSGS